MDARRAVGREEEDFPLPFGLGFEQEGLLPLLLVVGEREGGASEALKGGERPLPKPREPRFMIMAGVTLAGLVPCVEELSGGEGDWDCVADFGGAGGGIERSTGEGVSATASPTAATLSRLPLPRIAGVEPALTDPRTAAELPRLPLEVLELPSARAWLALARMEVCLFRECCVAPLLVAFPSSPLSSASLFDLFTPCLPPIPIPMPPSGV